MILEQALARHKGAETFRFGDSAALSAELLALVRVGRKRATCSHLGQAEALPELGRRDIALNWDGAPALVIETVELVETTWAAMTEEQALMEGEDESLESWRANHMRYYKRLGVFDPDMTLLWERFEVVDDLEEPLTAVADAAFTISGRGTFIPLRDLSGLLMIGDRLICQLRTHPVVGVEFLRRRAQQEDLLVANVAGVLRDAMPAGTEVRFERGPDV